MPILSLAKQLRVESDMRNEYNVNKPANNPLGTYVKCDQLCIAIFPRNASRVTRVPLEITVFAIETSSEMCFCKISLAANEDPPIGFRSVCLLAFRLTDSLVLSS
jgi:hypothetical protein